MKTPFRGYTAILYKEFLVVLRDPLTLFFMFVPPLIQLIAFGFALDTDVKNLSMVVLDEDRTVESRQIVDRFVNTGTFKFKGQVSSPAELSRAVREGKAYVGLQIPLDSPGICTQAARHGFRSSSMVPIPPSPPRRSIPPSASHFANPFCNCLAPAAGPMCRWKCA